MIKNPYLLYYANKNDVLFEEELTRVCNELGGMIFNTTFSDIITDQSGIIGYFLDIYFFLYYVQVAFPNMTFEEATIFMQYDDLFIFNYNMETRIVELNQNAFDLLLQHPRLDNYMLEYNAFIEKALEPATTITVESDSSIIESSSFSYKKLFVICVFTLWSLNTIYNYLYSKYYSTKETPDNNEDSLSSIYEEFLLDIDLLFLLLLPYTIILCIKLIILKFKR